MPRKATLTLLPVIGAGLAATAAVKTIFRAAERPSWPPPDDAITPEGAMEAVAAFARGAPTPRDVGLPYAWSTAASVEPWATGAEFYPRILADVAAATTSIHILMFGWKPGTPASALVGVLLDKLRQGVEVKILVDEFGSRPYSSSEDMYRELAAAGAEIAVNSFVPPRRVGRYPSDDTVWPGSLLVRADHRKLYVIDGEVAWTGGAGIEDHFGDGRFFDVMVRVTGDIVRQAQAVFVTSLAGHGIAPPHDLGAAFPAPADAGSMPAALTQVVDGGHVSATQAARALIDGASRRLDIMNPYLTDRDMIDRIIAAARRGAAVRVVVSETSNNALATYALRHHYERLTAAGIEIWEFPDAVVHAKLIAADDHVQFGTLNLDAWALYRNFEIAMVVEDAGTADRFAEHVFAPAIEQSRPGRPRPGVGERAFGIVANGISHFL